MCLNKLLFCFILFYCTNNVRSLSILSLNSSAHADIVVWSLENKNGSIRIAASVPGGVYTDLQRFSIIGDIFEGFNDVLTRWVAYDTWTYTANFEVANQFMYASSARLVLHGVDTVSYVEVNGSPIGKTDNMFVRYVFDVKNLKEGINTLKIAFDSPVEVANARSKKYFTAPDCVPSQYHGECHANQMRKMQASFSWDWGPAFPSVGIWKNIYIEFFNDTMLRSVTTHITKKDQHWDLKIRAYLESEKSVRKVNGVIDAVLHINEENYLKVSKFVDSKTKDDGSTEIDFNIVVSDNVVSLWWPNGYGEQPLYDLEVTYTDNNNHDEQSQVKVQVGFRTLELVEDDISTVLERFTVGNGLTFYFKVNGYPLFMKGTNWIPSHILPEHAEDKQRIDHLLESVKEAHMGMIRVWGGGIYEPDYFYKRCDELGILVWHDLMFACSMYPVDTEFLRSVSTEIEQNVIRLQHHPSIAIWAGNNENEGALRGNWYGTETNFEKYKQDYIKLYVDVIKPIVENIDPGRRYIASSPSNGKESEKEGYIAETPSDPRYGDTHYYSYFTDNWDQNTYPFSRFASEYGFQSMPSVQTMRTATNLSSDFVWDSDFLRHRQHSPQGYRPIRTAITRHMERIDDSAPDYFEKFVYFSQISQAMSLKAETEFYRQCQEEWHTMGALYWQLNDVWQAPSWSSIEHGGKWKMLHYFAKNFFAPVLVSPRRLDTGDIDVYLINDRLVPIDDGEIIVDFFNYHTLVPFKSLSFPADVGALAAKKQNISLNAWTYGHNASMLLRFSIKAKGVVSSPYNYVFPAELRDVQGMKTPKIRITVGRNIENVGDYYLYTVDIRSETVVLFLWLEANGYDGRFLDNGFIITVRFTKIYYRINKMVDFKDLEKAITYKYYFHENDTL